MEKELDGDEIVVEINLGAEGKPSSSNPSEEIKVETTEKQESAGSYSLDPPPVANLHAVQLNQYPSLGSRKKMPSFTSSLTTEIPQNNRITSQPQVDEDIDPIRSLPTSPYSKPKSRFIDKVSTTASPSPGEKGEDVDFTQVAKGKRHTKVKLLSLIEFSLFVCITLVISLSKTMDKLENIKIWSLELWKFCVLALAIFCGRLLSGWFMNAVVFLIKNEFLHKKEVLYFVYSLQKSIQVFIWLGLILLSWGLLVNRGGHRSRATTKVINRITRVMASTLVVVGAWVLKILLVKMLASSFLVKQFFDRVQENIFCLYILQTLSGPQLMGDSESINGSRIPSRHLSFKSSTKEGGEQKKEKLIDVHKLQKMESRQVSGWMMEELIKVITNNDFSMLSNANGELEDLSYTTIPTSDWEPQSVGYAIFRNVANPGQKYINKDDLLRFMSKDDVELVLQFIGGGAESAWFNKELLADWVVNVYHACKSLACSIYDTKALIKDLNKFVTAPTIVVLLILWLILTGIASTEVLLFISSQFLLAVFSFGASAKSTIEAIIFVFVTHPFDVGDRCVVDGVELIVEEMSILTTIFLGYGNEKIYYPNSLLATKSIINFYRSPDMHDFLDFDLDVHTTYEKIDALKAKIKKYIESEPQLWHVNHSVRVKGIEDANKMKMCLYVTHQFNFQDRAKKGDSRSKLVLELKKIFEELGITYHYLFLRSSD